MSQQRQFDFKRATKLRALERVVCNSGVKGLLKALDGFARDERTCKVTMKRLALSMGVSPKTAQRSIRTAEAEGLLTVTGEPVHGQANTYRIEWQRVFDLPDGVSGGVVTGPPATPVKPAGTPGQSDRGPRSICPGTPVNLGGGPRSDWGGVCATDSYDKVNDTVRPLRSVPPTGRDGGGGVQIQDPEQAISAVASALAISTEVAEAGYVGTERLGRPSGWWAWKIKRGDLLSQKVMGPFFQAAVAAGLLDGKGMSAVRFLALARTTHNDPTIQNVTGYLVKIIERGDWNYLDPGAIDIAYRIVRPNDAPLTPAQRDRVREPQKARQTP